MFVYIKINYLLFISGKATLVNKRILMTEEKLGYDMSFV